MNNIGTRYGRVTVGQPIGIALDAASGDFSAARVDHKVEGVVPFSVGRTFNSKFVVQPILQIPDEVKKYLPFGPGWRASWQIELRLCVSGFIYTRADGEEFSFYNPNAKERSFAVTGRLINPSDCVELQRIDERHVRVTGFGTDRSTNSLVFEEWSHEQYRLKSIERTSKARLDFYYDEQSRVVGVTQSRERRRYGIQYEGHQGDQVSRVFLHLPDGSSRLVAEYHYDNQGHLIEVFNSRGSAARYAYDEEDRITHEKSRNGSEYELRYQGTACVYARGTNGFAERTVEIDRNGHITHVADSHGNVTRYTWNDHGQVLRTISPTGNTTSQIFDRYDRLIQYGQEDGSATDYEFDELGRIEGIRTSCGEKTAFYYDDCHRLIAYAELVNGEVVTWVKFTHDEDHNVTSIQINDGPPWKYDYTSYGEVARITAPSGATTSSLYDDRGGILAATNWDGQTWKYVRDALGRVVTETDPLGQTLEIDYLDEDGRSTQVTDRDGRIYERHVSEDDRSIQVVRPGGATRSLELSSGGMPVSLIDEMGAVTQLEWGTEPGELTRIINANDAEYTFEYDADMRVISRKTFDGRVLKTEYKRGRVAATVDGAGQKTSYEYNRRGFVSKQTSPDGVTQFRYDLQGLLTNMETPTSKLVLHRDVQGSIVAEEVDGVQVERKLDVMGQPIAHSTPYGPTTSFAWTLGGDCQSIKYGDVAVDFTRDAFGREIGRQLGEAGYFQQSYNPVGSLLTQAFHWTPNSQPGAKPLAPEVMRRFGFDARGFLESIEDRQRGPMQLMHNARGDLTGVVRENGISDFYMYDACRNRIYHAATQHGAMLAEALEQAEREHKVHGEVPFDLVAQTAQRFPHDVTNQGYEQGGGGRNVILTGPGRPTTELQYNANGQVVVKTVSSGPEKYTYRYDWNARGELIAVTAPNGKKWEYRYDASGRRIEKKSPTGDIWRFVWMGHELLHTLKNDKLAESYVYEPGGGCPILRDDGAVHFILPDQNDSPAEEVGPDGKLEYVYQKGTWGEGFEHHGETGGQAFLGQWCDGESGLHYSHFRYYDPETGRYLSPDPIGLAGRLNVYGYAPDPLCGLEQAANQWRPTPLTSHTDPGLADFVSRLTLLPERRSGLRVSAPRKTAGEGDRARGSRNLRSLRGGHDWRILRFGICGVSTQAP
ncbi:MAG: DUF6531 domain-containing protein [Polyangiaceae bacterium]|nr:DUF6531 domain-containing protein [Polyangiaceae bacterium]